MSSTLRRTLLALIAASILLAGCSARQNQADAHLEKASRLLGAHKIPQARAEIDAAIRAEPRRVSTYQVAGSVYAEADRYADATALFTALLDLDKRSMLDRRLSNEERAQVYTSLGLCWQKLGRFSEAERAYKDALAVAPDSPELMNDLGYFYADEGIKLPEAVRMLKRAVELAPGQSEIIDSLGWAQYKLGDLNEAASNLAKAVELKPEVATMRYHLGAVYARLGRRPAARIELEKALILDKTMKEASCLLTTLQK